MCRLFCYLGIVTHSHHSFFIYCMVASTTPAADNSLAQLLQLSQHLHRYSDEDLQAQLYQLAFVQAERLVPVLRLLLHNSQYLQQQLGVAEALVLVPVQPQPASSPLSLREQEISALLAQGYTLPQIGEKLFISSATVNNHCARMREKLGLRGRNALISFSIANKKV